MLPDYWGIYILPWICTHGYEEIRSYRKTLFIQSVVENGWWGSAYPTSRPGPWYATKRLFATVVLRLLFFEKFAGAPHGQKHEYGMGAPHRTSYDKKYIES